MRTMSLEALTEHTLNYLPESRISALARECSDAGDEDMRYMCEDALAGDEAALYCVAECLARAEIEHDTNAMYV